MTDEQIIKAYERCFTLGFDESTCYECPFYTATAKCTEDLRDSALDLINRQKAEIENLKADNEMYQKVNCLIAGQRDDRDKEIEELQTQMEWLTGYNKNLLDANTALSGEIEICKSEAIKEFTERIKRYIDVGHLRPPTEICFSELAVIEMIDNLAKRMTEVQE